MQMPTNEQYFEMVEEYLSVCAAFADRNFEDEALTSSLATEVMVGHAELDALHAIDPERFSKFEIPYDLREDAY